MFEETSFNIGPYLKEEDHIELILRETEQRVKLFIIAGIPEDTVFVPRTRKEISVWPSFLFIFLCLLIII